MRALFYRCVQIVHLLRRTKHSSVRNCSLFAAPLLTSCLLICLRVLSVHNYLHTAIILVKLRSRSLFLMAVSFLNTRPSSLTVLIQSRGCLMGSVHSHRRGYAGSSTYSNNQRAYVNYE